MSNKKISISKPIVSISEMAQLLQFSRARFYQLLNAGFLPQPVYDVRSKRPYYNSELQQKCLECRQSGIGVDGSYMLFYSPRKNENNINKGKQKIDPQVKELVETLESMGLDVNVKQVQQGISELYPDGIDSVEQGLVVRELFRHFKKSV